MAKSSFKLEHPLEWRQAEASRRREKYPDRIPVIVEKAERSDIPDVDRKLNLVPADLTVEQFVSLVRKMINLGAEKAVFVLVKNTLLPTGALMSEIYEEDKDEDGFLYVTYSDEAGGEPATQMTHSQSSKSEEVAATDSDSKDSLVAHAQNIMFSSEDEEQVDSRRTVEISKERYEKLYVRCSFYRMQSYLLKKKLKKLKAKEQRSELLVNELKSEVKKLKQDLATSS